MNDLKLMLQTMENNRLKEAAMLEEYHKIIKTIVDWIPRDFENKLPASEFIFYKPAYPYISKTFWKVLARLNEFGMKHYAYSACVKDKDGNPVLFYKLIIPLKGEKNEKENL